MTPEERADCTRAAGIAGYATTSEWIAAVLAREVELLDWSTGLPSEPTPIPLATTRAVLSTMPPEST